VPGSSDYFLGSIVAYSRDIQERLIGVSSATLERHGVVSEQTAREMARGARRGLGADVALAVTGIASPHKGRSKKPIGLTYIALSAEDADVCERHLFGGDRSENKRLSAEALLDLLKRYLTGRVSSTHPVIE
jgi:PncC family amidohydrolase